MRGNGVVQYGSTRVHAVILTRDRTDVLDRCVYTAMSTMGPDDTLTVLDDSGADTTRANGVVLARAACHSTARITHIQAEDAHDVVARSTGGPRAPWQSRTGPRDIAPLRNLSLLISAAVGAQTTLLVDDDICDFDVDATHRVVDAICRGPEGVVVGSLIGGTTEQDTITRLSDALRLLEVKAGGINVPVAELFRATRATAVRSADSCGWVSAGYMAFRLPQSRLFAFPPGYNEDWLWCLLHNVGDTRVVWSGQEVMHEPPFLRRPSRDDILFEVAGDLVLDCLAEPRERRVQEPRAVLEDLAQHAPDPHVMPFVRAETLVEQARRLVESEVGCALSELEGYGLGVLKNMLRSGEFEMDGSLVLGAWSGDAAEKHRSFAAMIGSPKLLAAFGSNLQKLGQ